MHSGESQNIQNIRNCFQGKTNLYLASLPLVMFEKIRILSFLINVINFLTFPFV